MPKSKKPPTKKPVKKPAKKTKKRAKKKSVVTTAIETVQLKRGPLINFSSKKHLAYSNALFYAAIEAAGELEKKILAKAKLDGDQSDLISLLSGLHLAYAHLLGKMESLLLHTNRVEENTLVSVGEMYFQSGIDLICETVHPENEDKKEEVAVVVETKEEDNVIHLPVFKKEGT